jgi:hypothetical protein
VHRFEKDGKEKSSFRAAKKGGYNWNPVNQNFAQLTNKIKKLEKALKKSGRKARNAVTRIAILTSSTTDFNSIAPFYQILRFFTCPM